MSRILILVPCAIKVSIHSWIHIHALDKNRELIHLKIVLEARITSELQIKQQLVILNPLIKIQHIIQICHIVLLLNLLAASFIGLLVCWNWRCLTINSWCLLSNWLNNDCALFLLIIFLNFQNFSPSHSFLFSLFVCTVFFANQLKVF